MLSGTARQAHLHGLDTLRSIAIIIVLIYHYWCFVSSNHLFGFMSRLGWVGVDLFFVLSGYLIGNQILAAVANRQHFSLKLFYIRRALRTLPNYYVVLTLYFIFAEFLSGNARAPWWEFLTFTQNFGLRPGQTFTHSWSLCIEEQFYFIFPVVVLLCAAVKRSVSLLWLTIVMSMLGVIFLRGINWYSYGQQQITGGDFWEHIYYSSFTRFDELIPGITLAVVKNFHPHFYEKLMRKGGVIFVAGIAAAAASFYVFDHYFYVSGYGFPLWMTMLGYTFVCVSFAMLVLAALSSRSPLYKFKVPLANQLALWSYAIYLIHRPVFMLLPNWLKAAHISPDGYLGFAIIMAASILAGWLLYRLVETPFMNLREKWYPNNYASQAEAVGVISRKNPDPAKKFPAQNTA